MKDAQYISKICIRGDNCYEDNKTGKEDEEYMRAVCSAQKDIQGKPHREGDILAKV